jgi:hypothetical protein
VNSGILRSTIAPLVLGAALVGYLADRAAPGIFTGSWPTTAEWVVAGGGVLGVLGAVGGVVRTPEVPRARRLGAAVVGLAGLGVATATVLGHGPAVPEAGPAIVATGPAAPGALVPGAPAPGGPVPGGPVPGGPVPGGPGPGPGVEPSGPGAPGAVRPAPGPVVPGPDVAGTRTRPPPPAAPSDVVEQSSGRRAAASSSEGWRAGAPARPAEVASSGTVTSGHWTSQSTTTSAATPDTAGQADERPARVTVVSLRVLGLGADVRAARRGSVEPALDVVLR